MQTDERIIAIGADAQSPRLSVLTLFHRDPSALLARVADAPAGVEFVLIDDGSASAELLSNVITAAERTGAPARVMRPAQSTASANLVVRRDFLAANPFDPHFAGFEDTDWALSAARQANILHVDNPATHAGLDDVATLMRKSAEAGRNFARLAEKHPQAVRRFAAYRAARALRFAPARSALRRFAARLAAESRAPMPVRRAAFNLYRAAHLAEHLA
jgi:hypothetical protein